MKKKHFLRCLGCLALSFSLCFSAVPSLTPTTLRVSAASLPGDGTAASPYQIVTAEDLSTFRDIVTSTPDACALLKADITVPSGTWIPIADYNEGLVFKGTFDGDGHSVSITAQAPISNYQGLFGYNKGTIKNVTVSGAVSGSEYVGGIAAVNEGTIENAANQAEIVSTAPVAFAGGIAGINYGDIVSATNNGSVTSQSAGSCTGGVAGAAPSGSITSSNNTGTITGANANTLDEYNESCVGGITGLNFQSEISISSNTGRILSTDTDSYVGGIAGLNNGAISDCYNNGGVEGTNYAGGIAGYLFYNKKAGDASLKNSLNIGVISSSASHVGAVYGGNQAGQSHNNYYLANESASGQSADTLGVTMEELKSGKVTYWLNESQTSDNVIWRQSLGADDYPAFLGTSIVYGIFEDGQITGYTNEKPSHTEHAFDKSGKCTECGYQSVSLEGHSLTLDGGIGSNFYYYIDPGFFSDSYEVVVDFTLDGKNSAPGNAVLNTDFALFNPQSRKKMYGFSYYINSYEMNRDITAVLSVKKDGETIIEVKAEPYRIYSYLETLHNDSAAGQDLKNLADSLATLDYYSSEHFQYNDSYEPKILLSIEEITAETLADYKKGYDADSQEGYPVSHYADSLLFHSFVKGKFYAKITGDILPDALYMGFRPHGSDEDYTYVKTEKSGSYYFGYTDQIPAPDLSVMYDIAFFEKNGDNYRQVSVTKISGAYSYLYSMLNGNQKDSMKDVSRALFLYGEYAKAYFQSVNKGQ